MSEAHENLTPARKRAVLALYPISVVHGAAMSPGELGFEMECLSEREDKLNDVGCVLLGARMGNRLVRMGLATKVEQVVGADRYRLNKTGMEVAVRLRKEAEKP